MASILIEDINSFDLKKAMDERKLVPGYKRFWPLFITFCILALALYALAKDFDHAVEEFNSPVGLCILGSLILWCVVQLLIKEPEDLELTYPKEYINSEAYKTQIQKYNAIKEIKKIWKAETVAYSVRSEKDRSSHDQVARTLVEIKYKEPSFISTNIKVPMMEFQKEKIYFFPNTIIIDSKKQQCINIKNQNSSFYSASKTSFIENGARPPSDARVIGRTWTHVNINGERDKRVKNNPELPICEYGKITLSLGNNFETIYELILSDISQLPQVESFFKNLISTSPEKKEQMPANLLKDKKSKICKPKLSKDSTDELNLGLDEKKLYAKKIAANEIDPEKISFEDFSASIMLEKAKKLYAGKIASGEINPEKISFECFTDNL